MNKELIKQLKEGKIAVKNDGTVEELRLVLKESFHKDKTSAVGICKYYYNYNNNWTGDNFTNLPPYSVKEFLKEEIMLPMQWCVKVNEITSKWFNENSQNNICDYHSVRSGYLHYPHKNLTHHFEHVLTGYKEITFEEFKKHILKEETMERKIIGYKLIKPEYKDAINRLLTIPQDKIDELTVDGYKICINDLQKAGVLDIWFEKVYEKEFKAGDWVNVDEHSWDHGVCQLTEVTSTYFKTAKTTWDIKSPYGLKTRKATPEEIEEALQPIQIGGYEVKFPDRNHIEIDGVKYFKDHINSLIVIFKKGQIKSLNVGCSGQYTVDLGLLEKISAKFY